MQTEEVVHLAYVHRESLPHDCEGTRQNYALAAQWRLGDKGLSTHTSIHIPIPLSSPLSQFRTAVESHDINNVVPYTKTHHIPLES